MSQQAPPNMTSTPPVAGGGGAVATGMSALSITDNRDESGQHRVRVKGLKTETTKSELEAELVTLLSRERLQGFQWATSSLGTPDAPYRWFCFDSLDNAKAFMTRCERRLMVGACVLRCTKLEKYQPPPGGGGGGGGGGQGARPSAVFLAFDDGAANDLAKCLIPHPQAARALPRAPNLDRYARASIRTVQRLSFPFV